MQIIPSLSCASERAHHEKKKSAMSALVHGGNSEPKQTFRAHVYLTYVFVCI